MATNDFAYTDMVRRLTKPGGSIAPTINAERANLLHHTLGIAGEAGEIVDAVKKHVIYGLPLDVENLVEELGDLEFYMAGLRDAIKVIRSKVIDHNVSKLTTRYPTGGYSDEDAKTRADKNDES